MKILFFIGTLNTGGAERQLLVLAKGLSARGHKVSVVTLYPGGQIANDLDQEHSVKLLSLWPRRSKYILFRMIQIVLSPLLLRRLTPRVDCLYSMLEVSNFIAWLATRFKRNISLIWGIRSSSIAAHWKMALFEKLCAYVSPTIELLISNSHAGLNGLLKRGYRPQQYTVISNGIDTERFQYNEKSGKTLRHELGIHIDQPLVGIVARLDLMKDHPVFLRAAALVAREVNDVKFICVGDGPDIYTCKLHALANELGLKDRVIWLGDRSDIVSIYSALDIFVLSSSCCEGFSNVIGEAMSCGLPCVATNVGDAAMIIGDQTRVVEPGNPEKLALAIINTLREKGRYNREEISRNRIEEKFSIEKLIDLTEQSLNGNRTIE